MKRLLSLLGIGIIVLCYASFSSRQRGPSKAEIRTLKNGHFQLLVNRRPYIIKGVCYHPIPIGQNQDYDFWNDENEPWKVDGQLMQKMGINTVRFYQAGSDAEATKKVMRDLFHNFGIRTCMGHWLGFWDYPGPFYADENFRKKVQKDVLAMVEEYKDEPGLLMWILGNENNYSFSGTMNAWSSKEIDAIDDPAARIEERARIYYSFVNELAKEIHAIDPYHLVALGNGELKTLNVANKVCPDVDVLASIIYRGKSFGNIFNNIKSIFDKPLVLIEFGCDAFDAFRKQEDQEAQAQFLESQWVQIYKNLADQKGQGNCIGGTLFEWNDEWWKYHEYDPQGWLVHDEGSDWSNGAYYFDIKVPGNKNMNEEWFGIVALSKELKDGINKRVPRKSFYVLREFWQNPDKVIHAHKEKPAGKQDSDINE